MQTTGCTGWRVILVGAFLATLPGVANAARARVTAGELSPPSRLRPDAIASRFVAQHPELAGAALESLGEPEVRAVPDGRGWVARFRQSVRGVPVIGGGVVLRIDAEGRVRRIAATTEAVDSVDTTPRVVASEALAAAKAHGANGVFHPNSMTLAIDPRAALGPRLVWAVRLQPIPQLLENAIYLIDAKSGAFLKRVDLLKYGKANVFKQNPMEESAPEASDFPEGFAPTEAASSGGDPKVKKLKSPLLEGLNCIDEDKTTSFMGINVHICTVTPTAISTDAGDFTNYTPASEPWTAPNNGCPNGPLAGGGRQPKDEFAEQHMYWHVANTYAFFRTLFAAAGMPDFTLREKPFPVAVNLCTPDFSGGFQNLNGPLVPFDNAFFSPGMNNPISQALIGGRDAIMFGQGTKYDFAYDGDVIAHEFVHAVIDTLGKLQLGGFEDEQGLNDDQGAMNEALADYFSGALGKDAALGEYAGRNIPNGGAEGAIRDLRNTKQCALDRWGEVHQDSEAFSAGVWGGRVAVAGDPTKAGFDEVKAAKYDRAVLTALMAFTDAEDMPSAAQAIADEVGMLLDAAAKQAVLTSFATHGFQPGCERVIPWTGKAKDVLFLDGTDSQYAPSGAGRVPSFVQFRIEVPAGNDSITMRMNVRSGGGGGGLFGGGMPPDLALIRGPMGQPIKWVVGTDGGNEEATAKFSGSKGEVFATLSGLMPGTYNVMIVNSGGGGSIGTNIRLETSCADAGGCVAAPPDMTPDPGQKPADGGCSCDVGGRGAGAPGLALALLGLVALVRLARRRRFSC
jgi:MYXO-CTERM domain-containing protein